MLKFDAVTVVCEVVFIGCKVVCLVFYALVLYACTKVADPYVSVVQHGV